MDAFEKLMDLAKGMGADNGSSFGNETLASTKVIRRPHIREKLNRKTAFRVRANRQRRFINNNKIVNPE